MTMDENKNATDVTSDDVDQYNAVLAALMDLAGQAEEHGCPASIFGAALVMYAGKFCAATGWSAENFEKATAMAFASYTPSEGGPLQ